jgi:plastocyanin
MRHPPTEEDHTVNPSTATTSAGLRRATLPLLALVVLAVAGCGSSSSSSTSSSTPASTSSNTPASTAPAGGGASGGSVLHVAANTEGQLKYNTTSLTAKAGTVTIGFTNASSLAHNLTVESSSGSTVGATPTFEGGTKTLSLSLKPGTYKFFCTVPGHRQAGMEGTLTVQ